MIFSVNYHSQYKQEAQEIRCPINQLGTIFTFIKDNPNKRYNIIMKNNSFSAKERQTDFICLCQEVAWMLCNYTHCQIAYAVHGNTDNLHTHFILNSVSYLDGHKLHLGWQDTAYLKGKINALLQRYNFSLIVSKEYISR